jgi:large-conductance mechanosensitive channel
MIDFLVEESVITTGILSGTFTAQLLSSFKTNIIDPVFEKTLPSHKVCEKHPSHDPNKEHVIRWRTFLRDLLIWLVLMFIIYQLWKHFIHPRKGRKQ